MTNGEWAFLGVVALLFGLATAMGIATNAAWLFGVPVGLIAAGLAAGLVMVAESVQDQRRFQPTADQHPDAALVALEHDHQAFLQLAARFLNGDTGSRWSVGDPMSHLEQQRQRLIHSAAAAANTLLGPTEPIVDRLRLLTGVVLDTISDGDRDRTAEVLKQVDETVRSLIHPPPPSRWL